MPRFGQRSRQLEWVALAFRDHVRRRIGKIRRYSKGGRTFSANCVTPACNSAEALMPAICRTEVTIKSA